MESQIHDILSQVHLAAGPAVHSSSCGLLSRTPVPTVDEYTQHRPEPSSWLSDQEKQ